MRRLDTFGHDVNAQAAQYRPRWPGARDFGRYCKPAPCQSSAHGAGTEPACSACGVFGAHRQVLCTYRNLLAGQRHAGGYLLNGGHGLVHALHRVQRHPRKVRAGHAIHTETRRLQTVEQHMVHGKQQCGPHDGARQSRYTSNRASVTNTPKWNSGMPCASWRCSATSPTCTKASTKRDAKVPLATP